MVVPSTADGFRAAVGELRSLDGKDGLKFHTSTLPEDGCMRLLVKNTRRFMPESVDIEDLESLKIRVQGITQLPCGCRDHETTKDDPPSPIISVAQGPQVSKVRSLTQRCGLRMSVESYGASKGPCNASAASASVTRSVTADTNADASRLGALTFLEAVLHYWNSLSVLTVGEPHGELRGCVKWKEAKAAVSIEAPERSRRESAQAYLPL